MTRAQKEWRKNRWLTLAQEAPEVISAYLRISALTLPFYVLRKCAKCSGPFKALPRQSRRYFGKVEVRLCSPCRHGNIRASMKRAAIKRKLRDSTEVKNTLTHTTPKRRMYQESLEAILTYFQSTQEDK